MPDKTAKLTVDGRTIELPVITGTEGEKAIDISRLRQETGCITMDNGYGNTGSCESAITFIDGEKGILRYRGYPIEELAASAVAGDGRRHLAAVPDVGFAGAVRIGCSDETPLRIVTALFPREQVPGRVARVQARLAALGAPEDGVDGLDLVRADVCEAVGKRDGAAYRGDPE